MIPKIRSRTCIAVHQEVHDLFKSLSRDRGARLSDVLWEAAIDYWIDCGKSIDDLPEIMRDSIKQRYNNTTQ